ncbi:hypothetical protein HOY80DRAFT_1028565 [Tuber brumale]|nr:hypothetical protein HOY80DRAFT_1028565 [Tuber brumale]
MPVHTEDSTSEYHITQEDIENDLDKTEEDDEDKDVDFVNLYESTNDVDDRRYEEGEEGEELEEEESFSLMFIKLEDVDVEMMGMGESSGPHSGEGWGGGTYVNMILTLSWLSFPEMWWKTVFTPAKKILESGSLEEQKKNIEYIVSKRRLFLAGKTWLPVNLEAVVREDALDEGINLQEMDDIDRKMDRLALLNMATHKFHRCGKKEP